MTRFAHGSLVSLVLVFASACSSTEATAPAAVNVEAEAVVNADLGAEALVEEHDEGTVAWRIDNDGQVKAAVNATATGRVKEDVSGSLVYKVEGSEPQTVPLVLDAKTGLLVAAGPKLEADLTEVEYTVTVSGKPWTGVMHVPVGGTAELVAGAKVTAEAKLPDETVGPHGGTIQIVGAERLEMVADADTGETRVYVLDVDLKPVRIESRRLRMGFVAEKTTFVNFDPEPSGFYFSARLGASAAVLNPLRVTASLSVGTVTHAAIWGYRPGIRVYAPSARVKIAAAPRIRFSLRGGFDSGVDCYGRAHVKVHHRGDDHDHDDHDHHRKGNNGRHFGQDGTFARDSGGFKSDNAVHPGSSRAKGGGDDDRGHDHVSSAKSGGSSKRSSHDDRGGGDRKSGGGDRKSGGGDRKGGGGDAKGGGGKGGKK
ncbi:hypothetical protein [Polyangium mundeleinium]|uniref:DUF5666 domain-containing protein n=1 Tax=Polyangium mundeleinium TaxID=2995306 RepID=A0ABT5EFH4_9BACT|nr:hypothetical protein [Polyangium mundeleinium]MDC0740214.1 hypothetical protein [Polyangium mundeleinium]